MSPVEICRLESADYGQLAAVDDGYRPDPDHSLVIVAKQGTEIVGRTMLIRPFHIEGTWIASHLRHGTTGVRLFRRLEQEAKTVPGLGALLAYAAEPKIEDYLQRLGYEKTPLTVWMKKI